MLALSLVCALLPFLAQEGSPTSASEPAWDARAVEHVLARFAFGGTLEEIAAGVHAGRTATIDTLFAGKPGSEAHPPVEDIVYPAGLLRYSIGAPDEEQVRQRLTAIRDKDQAQLLVYVDWWIEEIAWGGHPLRERMALFWHGYFATRVDDHKRSEDLIRQNLMLREKGLGTFRELLIGILHDPAMLVFLDNIRSTKADPGRNLAREVLELFTLGEGNYTEDDVHEVARVLTGWHVRNGRFFFDDVFHDFGEKTILGKTSTFEGDELVDHLLAQPACARYVARRLLTYFEGREPAEERLAAYARSLSEDEYHVGRFLRRLLADPEFYSDAVVGKRICGPVDYVVGACRRLDLRAPPAIVLSSTASLGQELFNPPSVRGWPQGRSWATTASLLQRGNIAGMLTGVVPLEDVLGARPVAGAKEREAEMAESDEAPPEGSIVMYGYCLKRGIAIQPWLPELELAEACRRADAETPSEMVDHLSERLLAVPLDAAVRAELAAFLERDTMDEAGLRRLAHVILSLPEAHLN